MQANVEMQKETPLQLETTEWQVLHSTRPKNSYVAPLSKPR